MQKKKKKCKQSKERKEKKIKDHQQQKIAIVSKIIKDLPISTCPLGSWI